MGTWARYNTVLPLYFTFRNSTPDPSIPDEDDGLMAWNVQRVCPPWDMTRLAAPVFPLRFGYDPEARGASHVAVFWLRDRGVSTVPLFMLTSNTLLDSPEVIAMFRIRWDVPSGNSLVMTGGIDSCTTSPESWR